MKAFHKIQDGLGASAHKLQSLYVDYIITVTEALLLFYLWGIILQYSEALRWSVVMDASLVRGKLHTGIQTAG